MPLVREPVDFAKLIAYAYDHLANMVVILSGSQVGLLYDMLKVDDPAYPSMEGPSPRSALVG